MAVRCFIFVILFVGVVTPQVSGISVLSKLVINGGTALSYGVGQKNKLVQDGVAVVQEGAAMATDTGRISSLMGTAYTSDVLASSATAANDGISAVKNALANTNVPGVELGTTLASQVVVGGNQVGQAALTSTNNVNQASMDLADTAVGHVSDLVSQTSKYSTAGTQVGIAVGTAVTATAVERLVDPESRSSNLLNSTTVTEPILNILPQIADTLSYK